MTNWDELILYLVLLQTDVQTFGNATLVDTLRRQWSEVNFLELVVTSQNCKQLLAAELIKIYT